MQKVPSPSWRASGASVVSARTSAGAARAVEAKPAAVRQSYSPEMLAALARVLAQPRRHPARRAPGDSGVADDAGALCCLLTDPAFVAEDLPAAAWVAAARSPFWVPPHGLSIARRGVMHAACQQHRRAAEAAAGGAAFHPEVVLSYATGRRRELLEQRCARGGGWLPAGPRRGGTPRASHGRRRRRECRLECCRCPQCLRYSQRRH